jgi:uncharacterized protein (TIGR00290 family)
MSEGAAEPVLLCWSGGKDSSLALAALRADPAVRVAALLATVTTGYDRISMHGVRRSLLHAQAVAVGVPLVEALIPPACTNLQYEAAMRDALERVRLAHPAIRRAAFGDLYLEDVRRYREDRLAAAGMEAIFPLWGRDTRRLADEFIDAGFRARLVCVDTEQIPGSLAGRLFDAELLAQLPPEADPCGENGEFHTFVADGPVFRQPVPYRVGETVLRDGRFAFCDLLDE